MSIPECPEQVDLLYVPQRFVQVGQGASRIDSEINGVLIQYVLGEEVYGLEVHLYFFTALLDFLYISIYSFLIRIGIAVVLRVLVTDNRG